MGNSDNTLFVFLMYSTAMLVLPLLTFFGVKKLLEKEFHVTGIPNTAWSVICAVVVVNLIIMAYAWRGYKQEVAEEGQDHKDIPATSRQENLNHKKDN